MRRLSFICMKQSFAFVRLGFSCICLPMGSRSNVWMTELLSAAPQLLFSFQQKVSGQQIYQECLKNFEMIFLDLLFTSMLQGKIKFKDVKSMDPKMIAIILFHHFFEERFFLTKSFFNLLFTKFLLFQHNSNNAMIQLHKS